MATHFTADPVNKLIIITTAPTGGELSLDVRRDIYSALKADWLNDNNLNKYRFPITPLGGEALVGGLSVGAFYFLEYGWRIRPYEADHRLLLDGNLFTREEEPVTVPTIGNFNVLVNLVNSALVYSITAQGTVTQPCPIDVVAIEIDVAQPVVELDVATPAIRIEVPRAPSVSISQPAVSVALPTPITVTHGC